MKRSRPPWRPAIEKWPPEDGRRAHGIGKHKPFFRRVGCLFLGLNAFGLAALLALFGLALNVLGGSRVSFQQLSWLFPAAALFMALGVGLIAVVGMGIDRMSAPLDDLLRASDKIAQGDYAVRVAEKGPREILVMTRAFNAMAARLQAHDQQRRSMLPDVTHELRTPLTIIQGNLEGVLDGLYPPDAARLRSMLDEVQVLSRLSDDLRILAATESADLELRTEPADFAALIQEAATAFQAQADATGVKIEMARMQLKEQVNMDSERMRQVVMNLVSNALRYAPRGSTVRIDAAEYVESGRKWLSISVTDSGPGIEAADLPHIFDRYYKSRDSRGMGLGLAIVKVIVEAHGGKTMAASSSREGTTISFALPG